MDIETINVFLDSDKATNQNENSFEFRISPPIDIKNDEYCEVYVQNFNTINGLANIRSDEDNSFKFSVGSGSSTSIIITQGYYSANDLKTFINAAFVNASENLEMNYDAKTLKMSLRHTSNNTAFEILETNLSKVLQFTARSYAAGETAISNSPVDLNTHSHNLFFTVPEFNTNSRVSISSNVAPNSICRIPIVSAFGNYITFQAMSPVQSFLIRNNIVSNFTVSILTDTADIYRPGHWSASLVFSIKKLNSDIDSNETLLKIMKNYNPSTQSGYGPMPPRSNHKIKSKKDLQLGAVRENPYWEN